jgi:transforming growth factor-beta-induced protein
VGKLSSAETALGQFVKFSAPMEDVLINNSKIVLTDIQTTNGVIHVIDSVLLPPDKDIVDTAVADGRFNTLATALTAAGLVETLKGEGPFTVFAPTDDAFAKLPAGTVEALLADIPALTDILLYHVAGENLPAASVLELGSIPTAQGKNIEIKAEMGKVMANNAQIIVTDIFTTNGTVHVIDAVLLPPQDIVDVAVADGRFTTLAAALEAAGLVETLKGEGPFTVFAPTDEAFAKLPAGTVEALLKDIPALTNILLYHVVEGKVMAADAVKLDKAKMVSGKEVMIRVEGDKVFLNDSQVILTDIEASNGVIHVIDAVLLPPM